MRHTYMVIGTTEPRLIAGQMLQPGDVITFDRQVRSKHLQEKKEIKKPVVKKATLAKEKIK